MYNVRVKRFLDTEQITIFEDPVREDFDYRNFNRITGEIYGLGEMIVNPFTNELECMRKLGEAQDSEQKSYSRTKKKLYDYVRANHWEWFVTMTFDKEKVNRYDYEEVTKKLSNWLSNMKKQCPIMKYVIIPEQHKDGAFHFHGLFANVDDLDFVDSGKKDAQERPIYNIGRYKLGWTTATKIGHVGKASSYLMKYITKEMCSVVKGKKRYWVSKNVDVPLIETYFVEGKKYFGRYMAENALHIKTVDGYKKVTYIELEKGTLDFLGHFDESQSMRQNERRLSQMESNN